MTNRCARGFSLVEVMVALVVCSVGLLGLAKMESLALSSTSVAATRSIAAIQASSLASAMHANRAYWAAGLAPATTTVTVANGAVQSIAGNLPAAPANGCLTPGASACTMDLLAAYDVQNWGNALAALMPTAIATISCTQNLAVPVSCNIQIQWPENAVTMTPQVGMTAAQIQAEMQALVTNNAPTYVLYVQP